MKSKLIALTAVLFALFFGETRKISAQTPAPEYVLVELNGFSEKGVILDSMNNAGHIVGIFGYYLSQNVWVGGPFLYADGIFYDVDGPDSEAFSFFRTADINDMGQVASMTNFTDTTGNWHQYIVLYENGVRTELGTLGGRWAEIGGINDHGEIVGWSTLSDETTSVAFHYANGVMRALEIPNATHSEGRGINNSGQIIGVYTTEPAPTYSGFLYANGSIQTLQMEPYRINDRGQIAGTREIDGKSIATIYEEGTYTDFGAFPNVNAGYFAYGLNNRGFAVGESRVSSATQAFLYANGNLHNLNDLVVNLGGRTLLNAKDINDGNQIIGEGDDNGRRFVYLLNLVPQGSFATIQLPPNYLSFGPCPQREVGKDSLILVTHGWQSDGLWLDTMTNVMQEYLTAHDLNNWQVVAYKWVEKAQAPLHSVFGVAEREGNNLGRCLVQYEWSHIHFIGHSAGSALIQAAADVIKDPAGSPSTTIHCTFLDPFVGFDYTGVEWYGTNVDWADSYFAYDVRTGNNAWPYTEGPLDNAYNVDVSFLDPNSTVISHYTGLNEANCTSTAISSHGWPIDFYLTTTLMSWPEAEGFGFPLSREGANWDRAMVLNTDRGNIPYRLGASEPSCLSYMPPPPPNFNPFIDFFNSLIVKSETGLQEVSGGGFVLTTQSPSWLATFVALTNMVNLVSFDASFIGTNGAGLLTVYWDTNAIGSIDEQAILIGSQRYTLGLPRTAPGMSHMLGFRLDSFSEIQSTVVVSNVALGFSGVEEPFSLGFVAGTSNSLPMLEISGQQGFTYTVEASTNLVNWDTVALLFNTNGTVRLVDSTTNTTTRFYRAVAP